MSVFLSSLLFDLDGDLELSGAQFSSPFVDDQAAARRVSRTATLNGGAAVVDQGATDADLTFDLNLSLDEPTAEQLRKMTANHADLSLASKRGFFTGVASELTPQNDGGYRLTFLPLAGVR